MSSIGLPWSYYATIVTFGIFFASLNIYVLTLLINHPVASPLWLIGVGVGLIGLVYSLRMVRAHQEELIVKKQESDES